MASKKLLAGWTPTAEDDLARCRAAMPGGAVASDSAVVRWALACAPHADPGVQRAAALTSVVVRERDDRGQYVPTKPW